MEPPDFGAVMVAAACVGLPLAAVLLTAHRWQRTWLSVTGALTGAMAVGAILLAWLLLPSDVTQAVLWDIVPGTAVVSLLLAGAALLMALRHRHLRRASEREQSLRRDSDRYWRSFSAVAALSGLMQTAVWLLFLFWLIATWARDT
jgi:ABC-type multidrug transport system fused ATPase/permease subunit